MRANVSRWQGVYDRFPSPARSVLASARGLFLSHMRYAPETFSILKILRAHERWSSGRNRGAPDERAARNDRQRAAQRAALRELRAGGNSHIRGFAPIAGAGAGDGAAKSRTISIALHACAAADSRGNHGHHGRKFARGVHGRAGARKLGMLAAAMGLGGGGGAAAAGDAIWCARGSGGMQLAAVLGLQHAGAADSDEHFSSGGKNRAAISGVSAQAGGKDPGRVSLGAGNSGGFCVEPARIDSHADDFYQRRAFVSGRRGRKSKQHSSARCSTATE